MPMLSNRRGATERTEPIPGFNNADGNINAGFGQILPKRNCSSRTDIQNKLHKYPFQGTERLQHRRSNPHLQFTVQAGTSAPTTMLRSSKTKRSARAISHRLAPSLNISRAASTKAAPALTSIAHSLQSKWCSSYASHRIAGSSPSTYLSAACTRTAFSWSISLVQPVAIEETLEPGASVAKVARAHGVNANQVFAWRRQYRQGLLGEGHAETVNLLPVHVTGTRASKALRSDRQQAAHGTTQAVGAIYVELPKGHLRG